MPFLHPDPGEPCENCGYSAALEERQGFRICFLCIAWLDHDPRRILKVARDAG